MVSPGVSDGLGGPDGGPPWITCWTKEMILKGPRGAGPDARIGRSIKR